MKRIILILMTLAIAPMSMAQMYNPNMYGTGLASAYPPCSYEQTSIAGKVTKKSERFEAAASRVRRQLRTTQSKLDKLVGDNFVRGCESVASAAIRGYCGKNGTNANEKAVLGNRAWSEFQDHMTGAPTFYGRGGPGYVRDYLYAMNIIYDQLGSLDPNRMVAMEEGGVPRPGQHVPGGGTTTYGDCSDFAATGGGINPAICDAAATDGHINSNAHRQCTNCLKPTSANPNGRYPELVREIYNLKQEEAELKNALEIADAKVTCAQSYLDGEMEKASEFRECILDADPLATTAEYCLTCDETGKEQKSGIEWNKWLPGLISAGLWTAGGIFAYNQMNKTREGNWEAGYPSDDRQPWAMTNYVMNGAGQVIDTFKASGAFGCAPTGGLNGQGTMGVTNMSPYAQYQFGGSPFMNVGGALGYPQNMIVGANGQLMMGGGLYGNNPMGMHMGMGGNMQQQQAMLQQQLQQQQAMLQYSIQQGQRDLATMQAMAQLDAQLAQLNAQRQQIYASNPGFGTYGSGGMYGTGGMYGNGGMYGTGSGGLFGSIQGNISIGMYGTGGMYGMYGSGSYGGMYGGMYGGTPVVPPYTGATVPTTGAVPSTGSATGNTGGNTGGAVPSLGL